ncbi:hypothetical protein AYK26_02860 [Euryarchaeota archaeon SM23-78]|nr:MAG: hypothetical protein AYK26_02860 [Euryarchaeota archaeon SM23-78]MBW3001365.1 1-acyl-sn-glycerol-3-phosphate acyltransferase [Candidatus Woesearchaeota archaeon]
MVKYYNPLFQAGAKKFASFIFSSYFKINIFGKENIPDKGGVIFSFNHVHGLDPFIIGSKIKKLNYALAKKELFLPGVRTIMRMLGAYPVDTKPHKQRYKEFTQNYGLLIPKKKHKDFLKEMNHYLLKEERLEDLSSLDHKLFTEYLLCKQGSIIIHLPGTRVRSYEKIKNPKKGAAWKAFEMLDKHDMHIPILPGGIMYSVNNKLLLTRKYNMPFRTRVDISFGKPIKVKQYFEEYKKNPKKAVDELTDLINEEVSAQIRRIEK